MSLLTKIFVVMVSLLAVGLVALVVPFVTNVETFKQLYEAEVELRAAAERNAQNREADLSAILAAKDKVLADLRAEIAKRDAEYNDMEKKLLTEQSARVQASKLAEEVGVKLERLSSSLEVQTNVNKMLQSEINQRREQTLQLQTRGIELTKALRDKTTQLDTLGRQVRLFREKLAEMQAINLDLREELDRGGGQAAGKAVVTRGEDQGGYDTYDEGWDPPVLIHGRVTDVEQLGDTIFVAINIGTNDNVGTGMRFMIHEGDQFLGNGIVTKVDLNQSAARVVLERGHIRPNVEVLAGQVD